MAVICSGYGELCNEWLSSEKMIRTCNGRCVKHLTTFLPHTDSDLSVACLMSPSTTTTSVSQTVDALSPQSAGSPLIPVMHVIEENYVSIQRQDFQSCDTHSIGDNSDQLLSDNSLQQDCSSQYLPVSQLNNLQEDTLHC